MPTTTIVNPQISASIVANISSGLLGGTLTHKPTPQTPAVGTNAGNINIAYSADLTVSAGSPLSIDLSSVADVAGNTVAFGHTTHWLFENLSTTTGQDFTLGGGSNAIIAARAEPVQANGGIDMMAAPNPGVLRDATHKIFTVAVAAGTNVPARLTILGRTT